MGHFKDYKKGAKVMQTATLKGPLGWSIVSILVIVAFAVYAVFTLASPLLEASIQDRSNSQTESLLSKHREYAAVDIDRFNGRSAFYKPIQISRPRPPAPEPVVVEVPQEPEPIVDPGPPPPPARYTGPPLIAVIGDEAWFRPSGASEIIRLQVGEEKDGLTLVNTIQPSMVTVQHRRGEYEVPLFTNEEPFFKDEAPPVPDGDFFEEVES